MKKLEQIQRNKLISNYGGVGSIIETNTNGSLRILPYDQWKCFNQIAHNQHVINEPRLLRYVQTHGYTNVARLVPIPDNDDLADVSKQLRDSIESEYFPKWFYCPRCRKLDKYDNWKSAWEAKIFKIEKNRKDKEEGGKDKEKGRKDKSFSKNRPACPHCSQRIGDNRFRRQYLEQIRFVMATPEDGRIEDIPFDELYNTEYTYSAEDRCYVIRTNRDQRAGELEYPISKTSDDLESLSVKMTAQDGGTKRINLSKLHDSYIIKNNKAYKMELKGSSGLYFPNIIRSIFIPMENQEDQQFETPADMDIHEFRYLTNDDNYNGGSIIRDDLVVKRRQLDLNRLPLITRISTIDKLKETSVLLSYSRMGRVDQTNDWYSVQDNRVTQITPGSKIPFDKKCAEVTFMPAVEAFGEGLLFEVDIDHIEETNREKFVHTLCHIIMKEMEFQCGYTLSSLKEKIYIDNDKAGFLIYTIAGSEGSYGGLISLASSENSRIQELIRRGAERAKYCPNDPICINEGEHHCFACVDIPETSCIKFNEGLDRKLFLDIWK